ncbi:hypothetical protein RRG08_025665 [Elysia crispata]|uniref:Uncharacterized protein n=1 Tax=Elysia crispata TaxID=231223 RepID=A0AAE0YEH6_9GAST|nr:hypothetical protein RRG08_025665 [Elysia crispata]
MQINGKPSNISVASWGHTRRPLKAKEKISTELTSVVQNDQQRVLKLSKQSCQSHPPEFQPKKLPDVKKRDTELVRTQNREFIANLTRTLNSEVPRMHIDCIRHACPSRYHAEAMWQKNVQGREKSGRTDQRESRQREILAKWTRESLAKEEFWQNGPERVKPKRNYDTVDLRDSSQKKILGAGLGQREWHSNQLDVVPYPTHHGYKSLTKNLKPYNKEMEKTNSVCGRLNSGNLSVPVCGCVHDVIRFTDCEESVAANSTASPLPTTRILFTCLQSADQAWVLPSTPS